MNDKYFMDVALEEAKKALEEDEVPVGAVLVKDGQIISKNYNKRHMTNRITAHAEILVIEEAAVKLNTWKLNECTLYVTLEPCLMCYSALKQSRIKKVYVGYKGEIKKEYVYSRYLKKDEVMDYSIKLESSKKLLEGFFKNKRRNNGN